MIFSSKYVKRDIDPSKNRDVLVEKRPTFVNEGVRHGCEVGWIDDGCA